MQATASLMSAIALIKYLKDFALPTGAQAQTARAKVISLIPVAASFQTETLFGSIHLGSCNFRQDTSRETLFTAWQQ